MSTLQSSLKRLALAVVVALAALSGCNSLLEGPYGRAGSGEYASASSRAIESGHRESAPEDHTAAPKGQVDVAAEACPDVNDDGVVNLVDIQLVAGSWRCACNEDCYETLHDLNGDCGIDVVDVMLVVASFGNRYHTVDNVADQPPCSAVTNPFLSSTSGPPLPAGAG